MCHSCEIGNSKGLLGNEKASQGYDSEMKFSTNKVRKSNIIFYSNIHIKTTTVFSLYQSTLFKSLTAKPAAGAYFCRNPSHHHMKKLFFLADLFSLTACKNEDKPADIPPANAPKSMSYSIVGTYPHDTSSYTQGLLIYNGELYEGTGNYGKSKLKKVDLKTGKSQQEISLDPKFFGEGVTILNDTIYQLTWKEKTVFVYALKDFKKIKEFSIDIEGWGLTTDGKSLIASNGSGDLFYYEPSTFKLTKTQTVTEAGSPTFNLNELEYIDGFVYANQYTYPYIFKINPNTGEIVAKADLTQMWDRAKALDPNAEVPNGIAYDPAAKKIYITGKWWPELYEVQFGQ